MNILNNIGEFLVYIALIAAMILVAVIGVIFLWGPINESINDFSFFTRIATILFIKGMGIIFIIVGVYTSIYTTKDYINNLRE